MEENVVKDVIEETTEAAKEIVPAVVNNITKVEVPSMSVPKTVLVVAGVAIAGYVGGRVIAKGVKALRKKFKKQKYATPKPREEEDYFEDEFEDEDLKSEE